jgi:hypothetical protein
MEPSSSTGRTRYPHDLPTISSLFDTFLRLKYAVHVTELLFPPVTRCEGGER